MKPGSILRLSFTLIIAAMMSILAACEDEDNPADGDDWQSVTIVVLKNNTDTRIADAQIVIDRKDTCYTSSPDGECVYALSRTQHAISIFKTGYSRLDTNFTVTSNMSYKYFSLFNY